MQKKEAKQQDPNVLGIVTNSEPLTADGKGIPRLRKKVCIIGFAPGSMRLAAVHFGDSDMEFWGLNQLYMAFPEMVQHATRWFQFHAKTSYDANIGRDHKHHDWLAAQTEFPIYMQKREPDVPCSIPLPKDLILSKFRPYFTNSISWELALAIHEGFEEIHVYGVDMAQDSEYCVAPETMVLTKDLRYVQAGSLDVGDELLAFDEHPTTASKDRTYQVATVEGCEHIKRPCYKLTLSDGTEIVCSQEHRWLVGGSQNAWLETEKLVAEGDYEDGRCSHILKPLDYWEDRLSYDAGYIAAAFDGEGSLSQYKRTNMDARAFRIGFGQKDNEMMRHMELAMAHEGFRFCDGGAPKENGGVFNKVLRGGYPEVLRLLGSIRPKRLLDNLDLSKLGRMRCKNRVGVVKKEFVGEQEVVALKTSTGTFIAHGLASHNSHQRPSCEYFIGYAEGKGIKVVIPGQCDLLKTLWIYPFDGGGYDMLEKFEARKAELRQRAAQVGSHKQQLQDEHMQILGAEQNMEYIYRSFMKPTCNWTPEAEPKG